MGLRDWLRTVCCCCPCKCLEEPAVPEKEPLVRWVRAPAGIWGYLAAARCREVGIPACRSELARWACLRGTPRHKLSPLVPYRIACFLGLFFSKIFARKHKSSEAPETQVDACGKSQEFGGRKVRREVLLGVQLNRLATDYVFDRYISVH